MRTLFLTLVLTVHCISDVSANDSEHLTRIDGWWYCIEKLDEGDITGKVISKDFFDISNFTYKLHSETNMVYKNRMPFATLAFTEIGSFEYKNSKIIYTASSVKYEVIDDPLNSFTPEIIKELESDLMNDQVEYVTKEITNSKWLVYDPEMDRESTCTRDLN